jgi:hypothetical protein
MVFHDYCASEKVLGHLRVSYSPGFKLKRETFFPFKPPLVMPTGFLPAHDQLFHFSLKLLIPRKKILVKGAHRLRDLHGFTLRE